MKILVIGSNSFSGSNYVNYLLGRGHEVMAMSRSQEPDSVFLPYKWAAKVPTNLSFFQLDVNKNLDEIINKIKLFKPIYIVNFAAQGMVAESWKKPEDWYQTNLMAQVKLHNCIRKFDFIENFLNSRAACDLHLMSFYRNYDFPVTFTRAANVFGAGQQLYRIVPKTIISGILGSKLSLHGGGSSKRSFIHIGDVSDATYKVMKHGVPGETYHISTKELISIKKLVWLIAEKINKNPDDFVVNTDERLGKDHSYALDSKKIRNELSWADSISLEDGLEKTIYWVESNLDVLKKMPAHYIHKS